MAKGKRTHEEKRNAIEEAISYSKVSDTQADIAKVAGFASREAMLNFIARESGLTSFKSLKEGIIAEIKHPSPISHWIKPNRSLSWKKRKDFGCDLIVSTEDRSFRKTEYAPVRPGTNWSPEIEAIEDRFIQPIKRIRIIAHSYLSAGKWSSGEKLLSIDARIAESDYDLYMTQEDACIISSGLASSEHIKVGDKILGINGLKVSISEIRNDSVKYIIVNEKQIYSKNKVSRHTYGAVREIRDTGKLKIFFQKGSEIYLSKTQIREFQKMGITNEQIESWKEGYKSNWEDIPKGHGYKWGKARFSPTLVPFLSDIFGNELPKLIIENTRNFQDVLEMIGVRCKCDTEGLSIHPIMDKPKEGEFWDGYFWGSTILSYKSVPSIGIIPKKGVPFTLYPFRPGKINIPEHLIKENQRYNEKKDEYVDNTYLVKLRDGDMTQFVGTYFLHKAIFGEISNSLTGLIAIPINLKDKRVVVMNPGDLNQIELNGNRDIVVYREPVVSKENIQVCKVITSDKIPIGKLGLSVELQTEMYGDFDGDPMSVIGTKDIKQFSKRLSYPLEPLKLKRPVGLPKSIPEPRSEKEQIELAKKEHESLLVTSTEVGEIGRLTKLGFIKCEGEKQLNIVKEHAKAIEVMKDRESKIDRLKYDQSVKDLTSVINSTKYLKDIDYHFSKFEKLMSSSLFDGGKITKFPTIGSLLTKTDRKVILATVDSPYSKWIMLLAKGRRRIK